MQEAINEIIHTEQKHVRNLKIMKHQFYEQIKRTTFLTSLEVNLLFPNLDTILNLHCKWWRGGCYDGFIFYDSYLF